MAFLWGFNELSAAAERYAADFTRGRGDLTDDQIKYWTNAFAHAYVSAALTLNYDVETARALGDLREYLGTFAGYLLSDPPRVAGYWT